MQDNELESRLKLLSPANVRLDPIAAAYVAGKQNADRVANRWRGVAGISLIVAILPWVLPRHYPAIAPSVQTVTLPNQNIEPTHSGNIWQLQAAVLEKGLDGLPSAELPPARPGGEIKIY